MNVVVESEDGKIREKVHVCRLKKFNEPETSPTEPGTLTIVEPGRDNDECTDEPQQEFSASQRSEMSPDHSEPSITVREAKNKQSSKSQKFTRLETIDELDELYSNVPYRKRLKNREKLDKLKVTNELRRSQRQKKPPDRLGFEQSK